MSTATAALHTPTELAFVGADDLTGIVTFHTISKSHPATPNTTNLDTLTGAIICDCRAAECGKECWHAALVTAAWYRTPAMGDVRWLTDSQLVRYGKTTAAMVNSYRQRTGRVLPMDAVNVIAARSEWRRRAALAVPASVPVADDLPLAA